MAGCMVTDVERSSSRTQLKSLPPNQGRSNNDRNKDDDRKPAARPNARKRHYGNVAKMRQWQNQHTSRYAGRTPTRFASNLLASSNRHLPRVDITLEEPNRTDILAYEHLAATLPNATCPDQFGMEPDTNKLDKFVSRLDDII